MRWGNPIWLWALATLPLWFVLSQHALKQRRDKLSRAIDQKVWPKVLPELDWSLLVRRNRIFVMALALVVVALARPQWGTREETLSVRGLDVMFVLDVSNSMEVEDVVPSRLKKAKHFLKSLVERLQGDRVGVVVFAGSAYPASPLTTDLGYVMETIDIVQPNMVSNQGTDLGAGLEVAANALQRGAEDLSKGDSSSRAIILVSDGEDHEEKAMEWAQKLKDAGTRLFVFGVGTEKGGPIPVRDPEGNLRGFKRDSGGGSVVSTFKSQSLKKIAEEASGRYWDITPSEGEIDEVASNLDSLGQSDRSERRKVSYVDRYGWFLGAAIFLLLLQMALPSRKGVAQLRRTAAVFLGLVLLPGIARGDARTYIDNEKAVDALEGNRLSEARERLGRAQALQPDAPELSYNQGHLLTHEKKTDEAIQSFQQGADLALRRGDAEFAAQSSFNAGAVAGASGKYDAAVQNYLSAIDQAKQAKNAELEKEARENLLRLVQLRQEQKQKGGEGEGEQKKEDEQKEGGQDDQKKQGGVEDPKKSRERAAKRFESKKMTPEDAQKVMSELSNRERELQRKLKKQRGQAQGNGKDW